MIRMSLRCAAIILPQLFAAAIAHGQPFTLRREIPILARAEAVGADYTGDGVDELMAWWSPYPKQMLIDGVSGVPLRTWDGASLAPGLGLLPDQTGDGRREFLFSVPQAYVKAVSSGAAGGTLPNTPGLWEFPGATGADTLGLGENIAVTGGAQPRVLIGHGSGGRLVIADPATGQTTARISRDPAALDRSSFANLVADVGDLNGDGVNDIAVGANGRYPQSEGRIYLLSGKVTTTPVADVPVTQLPSDSLLALISSTTITELGSDISHGLASLGDPMPGNGIAENLLLVGTPGSNYGVGGAAAILVRRNPGGSMDTQFVARWINDTPARLWFGSDVQDVGDVNGDGVDDAAILERGDGSHVQRGRVLIVNGAGLLDGFSAADVIQELSDPKLTFSESLRYLGDYDHDGRGDLAVTLSGPTPGIIRIYSVPEPAGLIIVAGCIAGIRRRRMPCPR